MSGIEVIDKLITDVEACRKASLVLLVWNCLLTCSVIIALTRVKDRR